MISDEEVKKIARLAQLEIADSEVPQIAAHLNSILGHFQKIQRLDLKDVPATSHVHGAVNVMRDDLVQPPLPVEAVLQNAPDTSGRYIRVPLIIEQE